MEQGAFSSHGGESRAPAGRDLSQKYSWSSQPLSSKLAVRAAETARAGSTGREHGHGHPSQSWRLHIPNSSPFTSLGFLVVSISFFLTLRLAAGRALATDPQALCWC